MTRSRDIADQQKNLGGAVAPVVSGKNAIINGGFDHWQRGTSFTPNSTYSYGPDRFAMYRAVTGSTISRQASGLTGFRYCARVQRDAGNTASNDLQLLYTMETADALRFAGQTITLSFYARAGANFSSNGSQIYFAIATGTGTDQAIQNFTGFTLPVNTTFVLTSNWTRYQVTVAIPSNVTEIGFYSGFNGVGTAGAADYYETTGYLFEQGSVATPFSRAGGTIGGELALCQRYYYRMTAPSIWSKFGQYGSASSTTNVRIPLFPPVTMRTSPTSVEWSGLGTDDGAAGQQVTAVTLTYANTYGATLDYTVSGATAYRPYCLQSYNTANGYIAISAEL